MEGGPLHKSPHKDFRYRILKSPKPAGKNKNQIFCSLSPASPSSHFLGSVILFYEQNMVYETLSITSRLYSSEMAGFFGQLVLYAVDYFEFLTS